jgi:sugar lactone lactonase YvrE
MAERDGTLWIETPNAGTLVAFDPERGEVIDRIRIPGGVVGVTSTPSGLWAVAGEAEEVVQIDPDSRRVVARVDVEGPLGGLAVDGDQIWTVAGRSELVRIDPASHSIAERIELESFEAEALAIGRNVLWVSSSFEGNVLRVDLRTGRVRDRLPVDGSLFGGIVIGDSYWISGNDGTIYRLDADSGEVVDQLDMVGFGPIPAAGNLWTVDFLSNNVFRLDEDAD